MRSTLSTRVHRKLCLACGYDGPALQGPRAETTYACPNCGEDLYARPPRSYAELEGLDEEFEAIAPRRVSARATPSVWARIRGVMRRLLTKRR